MTAESPSNESGPQAPADPRSKTSRGIAAPVAEDDAVLATPSYQGVLVAKGRMERLPKDAEVILGREAEADITLPDRRVSRQHAAIWFEDGRYCIRDLDSSNGTFINRRRIGKPTRLKVADEVRVFPFTFVFVVFPTGVSDAPAQAPQPTGKPHPFSGELSAVPLPDLIQLFYAAGRSGRLSVESNGNPRADLTFVKGEIVCIAYGELRNEEALYRLMAEKQGRFSFEPGQPAMPTSAVQTDTMSMMLEACQRLDESRRAGPDASAG